MTNAGKETNLEFPINSQLLEEATRSREEWRVLKERLEKIDENKEQVTPLVYERVRKDYDTRLKAALGELVKKKEAIDKELNSLDETRKKIAAQLEEHTHRFEELKFRNTLGEFSEEEYQSAAKTEQDKIAKFETVLNAVDNNITRYKSVFEAEEGLFAKQKSPGAKKKVEDTSLLPQTRKFPKPQTDSKCLAAEEEEEGPDYFAAPKKEEQTSPFVEESETAKGAAGPALSETTASGKRVARVVIINGSNAGVAYPLKATVSMGRADSNTIALKDAKISRQHAQIQQQGNEFVIIDLNSSNGTYVNGQRIEEHVLSNGDEIQIGDFILQFQS